MTGTPTPPSASPRNKFPVWVVVVIAILVVLYFVGQNDTTTSTPTQTPSAGTITVEYEVIGTDACSPACRLRADLTLENDSGGTDQHDNMPLPYRTTWRGFGLGDFVYISAQNQGESGTLACAIYVNGAKVFTASASGAYSICTASGAVGR